MNYEVIIATYNGGKYISEQIDSILNQTVLPSRIIIRDDNSSDNTLDLLNEYAINQTVQIEVISDGENLGYIKNFERLISYCNAEVVFFADQDDIWKPNKAEQLLLLFNSRAGINVLFSDAELFNNKHIIGGLWEYIGFNPYQEKLTVDRMLRNNVATGATMAVKLSYISTILPFPNHIPHDYWIAINAVIDNCIASCSLKLIRYRQHENNQIGAKKTSIIEKIKNSTNLDKLKRRIKHHQQQYAIAASLIRYDRLNATSPSIKSIHERLEMYNIIYNGLIFKSSNTAFDQSLLKIFFSRNYLLDCKVKTIITDIFDAILLRTIYRNINF